MVRGKIVECNNDHINATLDTTTCFEHEYQIMIMEHTLNDLKGLIDHLISNSTPRWIEVEALIEKKDVNMIARYWFRFINSSIMTSQN